MDADCSNTVQSKTASASISTDGLTHTARQNTISVSATLQLYPWIKFEYNYYPK